MQLGVAPIASKEFLDCTGIGSEEDTLQNVYQLTPKPPRSDFNHFVQNDGKALRFGGKLLRQADGSPVETADLERK